MKKRRRSLILLCVLTASLVGVIWHLLREGSIIIEEYVPVDRTPRIRPDYVGTVIPPNIAPLNFLVEEPGERYFVKIYSGRGKTIEISSRKPRIVIPPGSWKRLLSLNRGRELHFEIFVEGPTGQWRRYDPITNTISREDVDSYLVYRLIAPVYNFWHDMGIYQRDLRNYRESVVLENRSMSRDCLNCHTFLNHGTAGMLLHIRGKDSGVAMLLARNGAAEKIDARTEHNPSPAAYSSWHPSGRLVAFSVNKLSQFFHTTGEAREVFDSASDLGVYMVDSNTVTSMPKIADPDRLETWPSWSLPDGQYLYFCSTAKASTERYKEIKYDLMRIGYDLETGTWGELETVLSADETGLSIAHPRTSPDGRFLLFCMCDYGNFPIFHRSADVYLMDLETGRYRRLECNSDRCDSWFSWSSNGRWIVFSSKRVGGPPFAKPFFTYFDENAKTHKPFLLPQKDPTFYDSFIKTYNVPELVTEPVRVSVRDFTRAIAEPGKAVAASPVTGATPRAEAVDSPWRQ